MRKQLLGVLGAALVTSCGGGGGNDASVPVIAAPSPAPSPSATAFPLPAATGTTLLNFAGSQQFDTLESFLFYDTSTSGVITPTRTDVYGFLPSNSLSLIYDAPSSSRYYFFNSSNVPPYDSYPTYISVPFSNASRIATDTAFTRYRTTSKGATYTLSVLNPGSGNSRIPLNYVGIGTAEGFAASTSGSGISADFRAFGYGFPADEKSVPSTGSGQYTGIVIGRAIEVGGTNVYTLSGSLSITMNFSAQTYTGAVTLVATNDKTNEVVSLGSYPLASTINYPTPLNTITASVGSGREQLRAKLAGSTAEELEGSFTLLTTDPRNSGVTLRVVGAVAGRR